MIEENIKDSQNEKASKTEGPSKDITQVVSHGSIFHSWPHLKYDFLQPNKIMDKNMHQPNHSEYNPRTLFVPKDFVDKQTPVSNS